MRPWFKSFHFSKENKKIKKTNIKMKVRRETHMDRVRINLTSCDQYEQQEMGWYPLIEQQEFEVNLIC